MKGHGSMNMDMGGDASSMPMGMSLLLSCSCKVGPLFVRAWTIESCGQYYVSLVVIALVCFLRHLLTMYKTRLILRLPEDAVGACRVAIDGGGGTATPTARTVHWEKLRRSRATPNPSVHNSGPRGREHAPGDAAGGVLLLGRGRVQLRVDQRGAAEAR